MPATRSRALSTDAGGGWGGRTLRRKSALEGRLPQGNFADAVPAEVGVDPLDQHRCQMLKLKRVDAFDPSGSMWLRGAPGGFLLPLPSLRRPLRGPRGLVIAIGSAKEATPLADDVHPGRDEVGFPEPIGGPAPGRCTRRPSRPKAGPSSFPVPPCSCGSHFPAKDRPASQRSSSNLIITAMPASSDITIALLDWYDRHRRDLPWRAKPLHDAGPLRGLAIPR